MEGKRFWVITNTEAHYFDTKKDAEELAQTLIDEGLVWKDYGVFIEDKLTGITEPYPQENK